MKKLSIMLLTILPALTYATGVTGVAAILETITGLFAQLNAIFIGAAVLMFFWGLAIFILKSGDPEEIKKAKKMMTWSIIALFLMVSVWGVVKIMQETIFTGDGSLVTPDLPVLPTVKS